MAFILNERADARLMPVVYRAPRSSNQNGNASSPVAQSPDHHNCGARHVHSYRKSVRALVA
jgi:hypothetical protein